MLGNVAYILTLLCSFLLQSLEGCLKRDTFKEGKLRLKELKKVPEVLSKCLLGELQQLGGSCVT